MVKSILRVFFNYLGLDGRDGIPGEPGLDGVPGKNGLDGLYLIRYIYLYARVRACVIRVHFFKCCAKRGK